MNQGAATSVEAPPAGWKAPKIALACVLVIECAVYVYYLLLRMPIWVDEADTVLFARQPWSEFGRILYVREANMVLYYLLMKAWTAVSVGEAWVRIPSAIAIVAATYATYRVGRLLGSEAAGVAAAALLALNPLAAYNAQEARSYPFLLLWIVVATELLIRAMTSHERRDWLLYGVFAGLGFYIHVYFALVLLAHAAATAIVCRRALQTPLIAMFISVLVAAPMIWYVKAHDVGQVSWIPKLTWSRWLGGTLVMLGGPKLVVALVMLGSVWLVFKSRLQANEQVIVPLLLAVVPYSVLLAASPLKHLFFARYLIVSIAGVVLLAGMGLTELLNRVVERRRRFGLVLSALIVVGIGWTALDFDSAVVKRQIAAELGPATDVVWRNIAEELRGKTTSGEALIVLKGGDKNLGYYRMLSQEDGRGILPEIVFPPNNGLGAYGKKPTTADIARTLEPVITNRPGVWLVISRPEPADEELRRMLANHMQLENSQHFAAVMHMFGGDRYTQITVAHYRR